MWWKKNRKRFACRRMKKRLLKHPSNGIPSDYLLNALEREFKGIRLVEYSLGYLFITRVEAILHIYAARTGFCVARLMLRKHLVC